MAQRWTPESHSHLVAKHARLNGVPESLVYRVIRIESGGNPAAVSKGNYGLMQIRLGTAKAMGYQGDADGLLDADTNMTYAVKYLSGAYRVAGGDHSRAIALYQRGYYYEAKAKGISPYERPPVAPPVLASLETRPAPAPVRRAERPLVVAPEAAPEAPRAEPAVKPVEGAAKP